MLSSSNVQLLGLDVAEDLVKQRIADNLTLYDGLNLIYCKYLYVVVKALGQRVASSAIDPRFPALPKCLDIISPRPFPALELNFLAQQSSVPVFLAQVEGKVSESAPTGKRPFGR